jgi:hypothetical protein
MTEKTVKIGEVVVWAAVPNGALVRDQKGDFALKLRGWGHFVATPSDIEGGGWESWEEMGAHHDAWGWDDFSENVSATIVALDLTGEENAAALQRLAEVFDVREALCRFEDHDDPGGALLAALRHLRGDGPVTDAVQRAAERLHALGWRKGQTAEDAARLLREAT